MGSAAEGSDGAGAGRHECVAALGAAVDDQGETSLMTAFGAFSLAWKDGRLTVTTRPGGASSVAGASGFTAHEDVRRALREMPPGDPSACVLIRPAELVATVEPFLAMAAPLQRERFAAYRQRLLAGGSYGCFASAIDATGEHAQAHGLLAVIAAGMAFAQIQSPHAAN